jgi:Domain of unknown function (DUF4332)
LRAVGLSVHSSLTAAGVDSPAELGHRVAANLAKKIEETLAAHPHIVRRSPSEKVIQGWIDQTKKLPKVVEH